MYHTNLCKQHKKNRTKICAICVYLNTNQTFCFNVQALFSNLSSNGTLCVNLREAVKKPGYFTVRLTVRGGGQPPPPGLTLSICEIFRNFSPFNVIP